MTSQANKDLIVNRLTIPPWQYHQGPANSSRSHSRNLDSDVPPSYAAAAAAPTLTSTCINPAVHAVTTDLPPAYKSITSSHTNQPPTNTEASNHCCMYYAVRIGRISGVFNSWCEAKQYVTGFPGAEYGSYLTQEEAVADWQQFRAEFEAFQIAWHGAQLIATHTSSRNRLGA
ncbi:hypothetical protein EDB19DRAFT_1921528 [Suillus lakei]|nr:hypothetical protein EDB19DRAFT_1921528 [Suillus lakei]